MKRFNSFSCGSWWVLKPHVSVLVPLKENITLLIIIKIVSKLKNLTFYFGAKKLFSKKLNIIQNFNYHRKKTKTWRMFVKLLNTQNYLLFWCFVLFFLWWSAKNETKLNRPTLTHSLFFLHSNENAVLVNKQSSFKFFIIRVIINAESYYYCCVQRKIQ